jgi:diadenosine tetraphosphate (Ap4A) HIT family hydrolase
VFCELSPDRLVGGDALVVAIRDGYPVSPGHTLVLPRRHVASWFDATPGEQRALLAAVAEVRRQLDRELRPDGYNIGVNVGEAAGQTVMHLHVHVIPRYHGDVDDPRGGVRGVIPARQRYDPGACTCSSATTPATPRAWASPTSTAARCGRSATPARRRSACGSASTRRCRTRCGRCGRREPGRPPRPAR